jgi:hypothetical protein
MIIIISYGYGAPSTPVSAVIASRWPRVSASERHSVELQRHLAVILKRYNVVSYCSKCLEGTERTSIRVDPSYLLSSSFCL